MWFESLPGKELACWLALIAYAGDKAARAGSAKWRKKAREYVDQVGDAAFEGKFIEWARLFNKPSPDPGFDYSRHRRNPLACHADNVAALIGMTRMAGFFPSADMARALAALSISAYRKVPGIGPRAVKLGNCAIQTLGTLSCREAIVQLAVLRTKVKFKSGQAEIDKALYAQAETAGLPYQEIEELGVPTFDFHGVGAGERVLGDCKARISVPDLSNVELAWIDEKGKVRKSPPRPVVLQYATDIKDLKGQIKDLKQVLSAQRDRIERGYLQKKEWDYPVWRERYLDHPVVGVVARRLIWSFESAGTTLTGTWLDSSDGGSLVDGAANPVNPLPSSTVRLWHPVNDSTDGISLWRNYFEARRIRQPFKQAHREVYTLTDAERHTAGYSNRFAAHILRQHPYHALCEVRGWRDKLRLMVDDEYEPSHRNLPEHAIRAEFWVESAPIEGNDADYVYKYLTTDQVRFYRIDAGMHRVHAYGGGYRPNFRNQTSDPLPLHDIPRLVFSEIMRDVDLFVGVASVSNDPNWADTGREPRQVEYWHEQSFGSLGATAETRRDVFQRLVPRLTISDRCEVADRFLIVKGKRKAYHIHLGSGNILMQPGNQYLCIVPRQVVSPDTDGRVFLPFEGDRTLSIILSKAFLLAEDDRITDPAILSQLDGRGPFHPPLQVAPD